MGITEDYAQLVEEEGEDAANFEWCMTLRRNRPGVELGSNYYLRAEEMDGDDE